MWVLLICPVIAWGLCSTQMIGGTFDTYDACSKAVGDVQGTQKPAVVYCSNAAYWIDRAKQK